MDLPKRKRQRLAGYDYSTPNYYFITICTHQKRGIFGHPCRLNEFGKLAEFALLDIPNHFAGVAVDKYAIMPNHVHAIVVIGGGVSERACPFPTVSSVVGAYKSAVSRMIHAVEPGIPVWQKSFYDHIIRNEKEYLDDWRYIDDNPAKWTEDEFYTP